MNEKSKLKEAHHFLDRMQSKHVDPSAFTRELSAFMAAARSVLQYAKKEATLKPGGQLWYDEAMANPLFCFFRELRDINIHERPVNPVRKFKTEAAGFLNIGDDDDDMIIPYPHMTIVQRYEFPDRPGELVIDLSLQYLNGLTELVEDGVAKKLISG